MIRAVSLIIVLKFLFCQMLNSFNYRVYKISQELLPYNVEKYTINPILQQSDDCYLSYDGQQYEMIQYILHNKSLFANDEEFQVSLQIQNIADQTYYCSGKVFFVKSSFYLDLNITFSKPVIILNYCNLQFYGINRLIISNLVIACKNQQNLMNLEALDMNLDRIKVLEPIQLIFDEFFEIIELTNIEIIDVSFNFAFISFQLLQFKQINQLLSIKNMQLKNVNIINTTFIDTYQDQYDFINQLQLISFQKITLYKLNVTKSILFSTFVNIKLLISNILITSSIFYQSPIFIMNKGTIDKLIICESEIIDQHILIFNSITLSNSQFYYLILKQLSSLFHQKTLEQTQQQISIVKIYNSFILNIDLHHQSRILSITQEDNMLDQLILRNINLKFLKTYGDYDTYLFIIYAHNVSILQFTSSNNFGIVSDFYIQSTYFEIYQMFIDGNNQKNQTLDSNYINQFLDNKFSVINGFKQNNQLQDIQLLLMINQFLYNYLKLVKTISIQMILIYIYILIFFQIPEYYKSYISLMSYSYSNTKLINLKIINNIIYDKHGEKSRDHIIMIYSPTVFIMNIALKFNQIANSGGSTLYIYSVKLTIQQCDLFLTSDLEIIDYIIQLKDIMYIKIQKLKLINSKQIPIISIISDIHKITVMNMILINGNQQYQSSSVLDHKSKSPLSVILIQGLKINNLQPTSPIIAIQQECYKCFTQINDTMLINSFSKSSVTVRLNQISDLGQVDIDNFQILEIITDEIYDCTSLNIISRKIKISEIFIIKTHCNALQIQSQYVIIRQGFFYQNKYSQKMPFITINATFSNVQISLENLKILDNKYNPREQQKSNVLIFFYLNKISHLMLKDVIISGNKAREYFNQELIYLLTMNNIGIVLFQHLFILQNDCDNCLTIQGVKDQSPLKISLIGIQLINSNSTNLITVANVQIDFQESIILQLSKLKFVFKNQNSIINVNQCELTNLNNNIFSLIENVQFTDNKIEILDDSKFSIYQADQQVQQFVISFDSGHTLSQNDRIISDNNIIDTTKFRDQRCFYLPSGQKIGQYKYLDLKHNYIEGFRVIAQNKHKQEIFQYQSCNIISLNSKLKFDNFSIGSESQDL